MSELYFIIPFFLLIALAIGFVLCRMMCLLCSKYSWQTIYMSYSACIIGAFLLALIFKNQIIQTISIIMNNFPLLRIIHI